jgi:hypothetical protein
MLRPGQSNNAVVAVQTVFDYTPEAVDKILRRYRNRCQHSKYIECRFVPAKQRFVLEGDLDLIEYAVLDFMDITQRTAIDETKKPNQKLIRRSEHSQLNITPIRWTEDVSTPSWSEFTPMLVPVSDAAIFISTAYVFNHA